MPLEFIDETPAPTPQTIATLPNGSGFLYNNVIYSKSADGVHAVRWDIVDVIPVSNFGNDPVLQIDLTKLTGHAHI